MTLIDLSAARERRDGPDPDFEFRDERGQRWFAFACDFVIDGREHSVMIWAQNFDDAERRLAALKATASIAGQVYAEVNWP